MIKAILFDLDNTLINRHRAFREMLEEKLPQILPRENKEVIKKMVEDILLFDENGDVERIESFGKWINKYHITEITAQEFSDYWSNTSGTVTYLYDDVIETLKQLKKDYFLAIVSNGNPVSQRRKLDNINLYEYFDYTLISGEIGIRKPDAGIFLYACNQLNVKPEECLYVGDNPKADMIGSRNAGMNSLYVDRFNKSIEGFDTIYQIKEIIDYLANKN